MGLFDSLKTRVKKGTDTVIDTTAKVGNYMEEKSATLMEKVPGGHELKEKATEFTEKAVDRVGTETKEMIQEGQGFIESHLKKNDASSEVKTTTTAETPTTPAAEPEKKVVEKETTEPKKSHPHKKK